MRTTFRFRLLATCLGAAASLPIAFPSVAANAILPTSPDSYLNQANGVRRATDRPWMPEAGRLGNLRHLQITASDCVVRVVSGNENRVFPGTREVIVVEQSRVLDADPDEQPVPRDVVLAPDGAQACPGHGSCGVSVTPAALAPKVGSGGNVCFTVQLATAHDLLVGGDGLTLLVDRVRQPALRIAFNPGYRMQAWMEQVELGLLAFSANAPVRVGGTGRIDFLGASSSNGGSVMYLHEFDARHVGLSSTTTGTQWSIRIGAETRASYHQPARAAGALAKHYGVEIDGMVERLEVPASRVDPQPLSDATRRAARSLRDAVMQRAGPKPVLPRPLADLPTAASAAASLPQQPSQRLAQVAARYLPASVRLTEVALWARGGRIEGVAGDAGTARDISKRLLASGEFTHASGGGGTAVEGGFHFSVQVSFACEAPGTASECPGSFPPGLRRYTTAQVRMRLAELLGPDATLDTVHLEGSAIEMRGVAPNQAQGRAALERLGQERGLFRTSVSGYDTSGAEPAQIQATLYLTCPVPPKADGVCVPRGE